MENNLALANECPIAIGICMDELQKDNVEWRISKMHTEMKITTSISLSQGIYEYLMTWYMEST